MSSITSIALSGMRAAEARLSAAASNLANAQTKDYRAIRVTQSEAGGNSNPGGVSYSFSRDPTSVPGVDTASELADAVTAKYNFEAAAKVIRVGDRLMTTTIDILA